MAQRKHGKRQSRDRVESDLGERLMIGATPTTIGDELRAARQAQGESLEEVARYLRIRGTYLEAIENGAFDALPGPTYAIGFVRAYARHLDLDADQMIQRFKEEAAGIDSPADLFFPEPVSESRVPRGGLVIIAILLALGAYGGWYYLSTKDLIVANDVPPVPGMMVDGNETPEALAELTPEASDEAPSAEDTAAETPASPGAEAGGEPPVAAAPTESVQPAAPSSSAPQGETSGTHAAAPQSGTSQPAEPQSAESPSAVPAIPAVPNVAQSPAATGEQPMAEAGPHVYGDSPNSRIILRARGDSWIQVRAADDSLLLTRTLRAGDSYRVPNQPGLTLMTGNAGALDIVVDGQTIPSLGPYGAVRRNVALDPERLKASGTVTN